MIPFLLFGLSSGEAIEPPVAEPERNAGGWLSLPDFTRGRDEYIRRQRIAMGIVAPKESPAIPAAVEQAAKEVAQRQAGVPMSSRQREAELARALAKERLEWQQEYAAALYAELYRLDMQRREDDLIVALLAT